MPPVKHTANGCRKSAGGSAAAAAGYGLWRQNDAGVAAACHPGRSLQHQALLLCAPWPLPLPGLVLRRTRPDGAGAGSSTAQQPGGARQGVASVLVTRDWRWFTTRSGGCSGAKRGRHACRSSGSAAGSANSHKRCVFKPGVAAQPHGCRAAGWQRQRRIPTHQPARMQARASGVDMHGRRNGRRCLPHRLPCAWQGTRRASGQLHASLDRCQEQNGHERLAGTC
jgi:hypothetical protein